MESKIIFYDNIDDDPEDFTRLQEFAQSSSDHIVADTIVSRAAYAGFEVTKSGPTTIRVAPGRLYSGGKRYARETEFTKDFVTALPIAGKKVVSVVTWGEEKDTDVQPRQFLINAETLQSEAQPVALVKARIANVNTQAGQEAPDPTPPIVDVGYTVIANVTLSTTGVEKIEMVSANAVPNLDRVENRVDGLEDFQAKAGPKLTTLESDLAGLANSLKGNASQGAFIRALTRLAVVENKLGIPSNAQDSAADYFLTPDNSDFTHPLSDVKVEEGARFPADAAAESALQIFDPLNPRAKIVNGMLFPAYDRELWLRSGAQSGEAQIAAYSYQTFEMVQRTVSRQRVRYGEEFTVCSNSLWWQTGHYDIASNTFRKDGEVFEVLNQYVDFAQGGNVHSFLRLRKVWTDTAVEAYWDRLTIDHTVNGAQIAETFLQGQDMWLDAVGVYFTRLAATGSIHLALAEVSQFGLPDLTKVIAVTTIARDAMKLAPEETVVPITPTYLQAGKRYAIVLTSAADHWVATVPGESFTQGTFFYVLDGAYAQGDGTRDLQFSLYRAKFRQARAQVELTGLQLSGGILAIDILADTIVPGSTTLSYEIQVGGVWYPLLAVDRYVLGQGGTIPPLLPLRVVFNGSVDMMPMVRLEGSRVKVSRPKTAFRHISATRTLPAPSTQIRAIFRLEAYEEPYHGTTFRLMTGAGYATETAPSSVTEVVDPTDGSIERTAVWNLGSPVSSYKLSVAGTTTTAQKTFHVAFRKDYAL